MTKLKDIRSIQQQNNFSNQILGTISTQLNRIESKYFTKDYKIDKENPEKEEEKEMKGNPLFKPIKPLKLGGNKSNDELIKILTQKLTGMEITPTKHKVGEYSIIWHKNISKSLKTCQKNGLKIYDFKTHQLSIK